MMDQATGIAFLDLVKWLSAATPATIFAVMWWLERTERTKLYHDLLKANETLQTMNEAWLRVLPPGTPVRHRDD